MIYREVSSPEDNLLQHFRIFAGDFPRPCRANDIFGGMGSRVFGTWNPGPCHRLPFYDLSVHMGSNSPSSLPVFLTAIIAQDGFMSESFHCTRVHSR